VFWSNQNAPLTTLAPTTRKVIRTIIATNARKVNKNIFFLSGDASIAKSYGKIRSRDIMAKIEGQKNISDRIANIFASAIEAAFVIRGINAFPIPARKKKSAKRIRSMERGGEINKYPPVKKANPEVIKVKYNRKSTFHPP